MKTALCFRYAQTLLQVGQADLLRGSFLSDAICEAHAAKAVIREGSGRLFIASLVDTR